MMTAEQVKERIEALTADKGTREKITAAVREIRECLKLGLRDSRELVDAWIDGGWDNVKVVVEKRLAQLADVEDANAKSAELRKAQRHCAPDLVIPYTAAAAACRSVCGYKVGKQNQGGRDRKTMEKRFGSAGTIVHGSRSVMAVCLQKVIAWCMRHELARAEAGYPQVRAWRGILRDSLVYHGLDAGAVPPVLQTMRVVEDTVLEAPPKHNGVKPAIPAPQPGKQLTFDDAMKVVEEDEKRCRQVPNDRRHRQMVAALGNIRNAVKGTHREFRKDLEQVHKRLRDLVQIQERTLQAIERVSTAVDRLQTTLPPTGVVIHVHGECHVTANEKPEVIGVMTPA